MPCLVARTKRLSPRSRGRSIYARPVIGDPWLSWPGIAIDALLVLGSFEFDGPFEERGWTLAGTIVPIAYIAWSLWLIISGVVLLIG